MSAGADEVPRWVGPWFLARCSQCGMPPQPFRDAGRRDEWGRQHTAGTGHTVVTSRQGQVVHVSVGNSDDKLPQHRWSAFLIGVREALQASIDHGGPGAGGEWLGAWYSESGAPWQNACWCVEYFDAAAAGMAQARLILLAHTYNQDAVAWTYGVTVMIPPPPVPVAAGAGETMSATLIDTPPSGEGPVARSCPSCGSIGRPINGQDLSAAEMAATGCQNLWHIETRPQPRPDNTLGDRFGYPRGWTNTTIPGSGDRP